MPVGGGDDVVWVDASVAIGRVGGGVGELSFFCSWKTRFREAEWLRSP